MQRSVWTRGISIFLIIGLLLPYTANAWVSATVNIPTDKPINLRQLSLDLFLKGALTGQLNLNPFSGYAGVIYDVFKGAETIAGSFSNMYALTRFNLINWALVKDGLSELTPVVGTLAAIYTMIDAMINSDAGLVPDEAVDAAKAQQEQLQQLGLQLEKIETFYPSWCHTFTTNISPGARRTVGVISLQAALTREGFVLDQQEISRSYYGPSTQAAVSGFQQKYGLTASGMLDQPSRAKLNSTYQCSVKNLPGVTPVFIDQDYDDEAEFSAVTADLHREIQKVFNRVARLETLMPEWCTVNWGMNLDLDRKDGLGAEVFGFMSGYAGKGDHNFVVVDLQGILGREGFSIDDREDLLHYFGASTEAALRAYQAKYGLRQTGILDLPTTLLLEKYKCKVTTLPARYHNYVYVTGHDPIPTSPTTHNAYEILLDINNFMLNEMRMRIAHIAAQFPMKHSFAKNFALGNRNPEIVFLQKDLEREGYSINFGERYFGTFGVSTRRAVIAFQQKYGILATGVVNILTRQKLNSIYGIGASSPPPPPPPPTVDLKVNGSDGPLTVPYGTETDLTLNSTNVSSCTIAYYSNNFKDYGYYFAPGKINYQWPAGPGSVVGDYYLTTSTLYALNCDGPGGHAGDSVLVNVMPPSSVKTSVSLSITSPVVTLVPIPGNPNGSFALVPSGSPVTFEYTAAHVPGLRCGLGGSPPIGVVFSSQDLSNEPSYNGSTGTYTSPPLTIAGSSDSTVYNGQTYASYGISFSCRGVEGAGLDVKYITLLMVQGGTVTHPPPTVDIKVNGQDGSIVVAPGSTVTVSWTSTNAVSCTGTGNLTSTADYPTSGSLTRTIAADMAEFYGMNCVNAAGVHANDSVSVSAPTSGFLPSRQNLADTLEALSQVLTELRSLIIR